MRGVDDSAGRDEEKNSRTAKYSGGNTGNAVGSIQTEDFKIHNHAASSSTAGAHSHTYWDMYHDDSYDDAANTDGENGDGTGKKDTEETTSSAGSHSHTITVSNSGGNETHPDNAYIIYIIKL